MEKYEFYFVLTLYLTLMYLQIVLSWNTIIEALMDDDFIQRNGGEDSAAAAHLVSDSVSFADCC